MTSYSSARCLTSLPDSSGWETLDWVISPISSLIVPWILLLPNSSFIQTLIMKLSVPPAVQFHHVSSPRYWYVLVLVLDFAVPLWSTQVLCCGQKDTKELKIVANCPGTKFTNNPKAPVCLPFRVDSYLPRPHLSFWCLRTDTQRLKKIVLSSFCCSLLKMERWWILKAALPKVSLGAAKRGPPKLGKRVRYGKLYYYYCPYIPSFFQGAWGGGSQSPCSPV